MSVDVHQALSEWFENERIKKVGSLINLSQENAEALYEDSQYKNLDVADKL